MCRRILIASAFLITFITTAPAAELERLWMRQLPARKTA
jgi:hypothetical protein